MGFFLFLQDFTGLISLKPKLRLRQIISQKAILELH